jgi:hypothetical protein
MKTFQMNWADATAIAISMLFDEMIILAMPAATASGEIVGAA